MPTAVEDVLELSSPSRRILADMEDWRCDAVDAFLYKDRSLENDPSPHRKPVEAA